METSQWRRQECWAWQGQWHLKWRAFGPGGIRSNLNSKRPSTNRSGLTLKRWRQPKMDTVMMSQDAGGDTRMDGYELWSEGNSQNSLRVTYTESKGPVSSRDAILFSGRGGPENNLSINGRICHQASHAAGWSWVLVSSQPLDHPARLSVARLSVITRPREKYLKHLVYILKIESHVIWSKEWHWTFDPPLSAPWELGLQACTVFLRSCDGCWTSTSCKPSKHSTPQALSSDFKALWNSHGCILNFQTNLPPLDVGSHIRVGFEGNMRLAVCQ